MPSVLATFTGLTGSGKQTWAGTPADFWTWQLELIPDWVSTRPVGTTEVIVFGVGVQRWGNGGITPFLLGEWTKINGLWAISGTKHDVFQAYPVASKVTSVAYTLSTGFQATLKLWAL